MNPKLETRNAKLRLVGEAVGDRPFVGIMHAETPLDATRKFLDQVQNLDEDAQRRILRLAQELRGEIIERMSGAKNFEAYRLPQLMGDLNRTMDSWRQKYAVTQFDLYQDYAGLGYAQTEGPVLAAGFNIQLPATSVKLLDVSQRFSSDLIRQVTQDTISDISREVILSANGIQSPYETLQKVTGMIDDPLTFSSIYSRAQTITRTEGGRIQSIAAQGRLEDAAEVVEGLRKKWLWSSNSRPAHAAINGQIREVDEPFDIPAARYCPADKLMFPRDPSGTACQTINCGCQSVPDKPEWGLNKLADDGGQLNGGKIVTIEDLGLDPSTRYLVRMGGGQQVRWKSTGKIPEEPGYLYHITPAENRASIIKSGLRPGRATDPNKWGEETYFRGKLFAAKDIGEIGNVVDAVYDVDEFSLFRFKREGPWRVGPEGDLYKQGGRVMPRALEIWDGKKWVKAGA